MKHETIAKRKSINLSIDEEVVAAAREQGLNISRVSESALRQAVKEARDAAWKRDNQAWIEANNRWVEEHGLPLEKYRLF